MVPNSIAVRSSTFAFVFPSQPELRREDNLRFYDRVTSAGVDLPEFNQGTNALVLLRKTGGTPPHTFFVRVDHFKQQLRFVVSEEFPRKSFDLFKEAADIGWDAFQEVWPLDKLGGRPVIAEVTLRVTAAAEGGDATGYLIDRILRVSHAGLHKLGRQITGVGLRLVFPVQVPGESLPLSGGDGNLLIESLLEDPSRLFLQLTTKWPSIALPPGTLPNEGPREITFETRKPSDYLEEVYSYLTEQSVQFLTESTG
jgi:hypothetical protein